MPQELADAGAMVDIRYGTSANKNLGNGSTVVLPQGINVQWQLKVNGFTSGYKTKNVDCSALAVGSADYCVMSVTMPQELADAGALVDIRYGTSATKDLGNGDTVVLPQGISVQWQLKVSGFSSGYKSKTVDCTALTVGAEDYCAMEIQMSRDLDRVGAEVHIRYSTLGGLRNSQKAYLPAGINIQWRLKVAGSYSGYQLRPWTVRRLWPSARSWSRRRRDLGRGLWQGLVPGRRHRRGDPHQGHAVPHGQQQQVRAQPVEEQGV